MKNIKYKLDKSMVKFNITNDITIGNHLIFRNVNYLKDDEIDDTFNKNYFKLKDNYKIYYKLNDNGSEEVIVIYNNKKDLFLYKEDLIKRLYKYYINTNEVFIISNMYMLDDIKLVLYLNDLTNQLLKVHNKVNYIKEEVV